MQISKAQYEAVRRYQKKTQKRYQLAFHKEYDKDIIDRLDRAESKCDYIRKLIRADINKKEE